MESFVVAKSPSTPDHLAYLHLHSVCTRCDGAKRRPVATVTQTFTCEIVLIPYVLRTNPTSYPTASSAKPTVRKSRIYKP
jgi:hypothetical protein